MNKNKITFAALLCLLVPAFGCTQKIENVNQAKLPATKLSLNVEHRVDGILAWSEAAKNGYEFWVQGADGPQNGIESWGFVRCEPNRELVNRKAQMVGGVNFIIYPHKDNNLRWRECVGWFEIFGNDKKRLNHPWKIKKMVFEGEHEITDQSWGTNRIETTIFMRTNVPNNPFSVAAPQSNSVRLKEIILLGPSNGDWRKAFSP